jgi:hypothetical protein
MSSNFNSNSFMKIKTRTLQVRWGISPMKMIKDLYAKVASKIYLEIVVLKITDYNSYQRYQKAILQLHFHRRMTQKHATSALI